MDDLPTIELLTSTHAFPGAYMFKVIGKDVDDFVGRVLIAVREELRLEEDPPFTLRQTPAGRHVAITLEPLVQSAHEVLAVYQKIRTVTGVIMLC